MFSFFEKRKINFRRDSNLPEDGAFRFAKVPRVPTTPPAKGRAPIKLPKLNEELRIPRAAGCQNCNLTGYRGRIGIFEAFLIDDEMEKFILKNPSIAELREKAIERGMVTMKQDGIIKVLEGTTTIEEIERVTGE